MPGGNGRKKEMRRIGGSSGRRRSGVGRGVARSAGRSELRCCGRLSVRMGAYEVRLRGALHVDHVVGRLVVVVRVLCVDLVLQLRLQGHHPIGPCVGLVAHDYDRHRADDGVARIELYRAGRELWDRRSRPGCATVRKASPPGSFTRRGLPYHTPIPPAADRRSCRSEHTPR